MNRDQLISSGQALLDLDARGALVPHGIGGHAREIIEGFIALDRPPAPDQTNAEVSDERLTFDHQQQADNYLEALLGYSGGFYGAAIKAGLPAAETVGPIAHIERAARELHRLALNRRAVTSQASEGEPLDANGYPTGSIASAADDDQFAARLAGGSATFAPVSKRVERLETALKDAEAELFEAEDKFWVAHCNYPNTTKPSFAAERQGQDKAFLATMSDRMKAARERARQALQGGRS